MLNARVAYSLFNLFPSSYGEDHLFVCLYLFLGRNIHFLLGLDNLGLICILLGCQHSKM